MKKYSFLLLFILSVSCSNRSGTDLVIYSPHREELIDLVVDMYESDTGKTVEVVTSGTGELMARVKAEKDNPNADLIWGGSLNTLVPESELFENYISKNEVYLEDIFKSPNGKVLQFTAIPSVILVNKVEFAKFYGSDVSIDGYQSIIDLANSDNKAIVGRISNADPSKSSSSYEQLINQIWAFAYINSGKTDVARITSEDIEKSWSSVSELIAVYDSKHAAGSGAVITDISRGETMVALTYEMAAIQGSSDSDDLEIVYPVEGSVVKADGAAIIKGAKNIENAKEFMDYLLNEKVQNNVYKVARRGLRKDLAVAAGSKMIPFSQFTIIQDNAELNDKAEFLQRYSGYF